MKTIKTVLFPINFAAFSLNAFDFACELTHKAGAKLVVISCVENISEKIDEENKAEFEQKYLKQIDVKNSKLNELTKSVKNKSALVIETHCYTGKMAPSVLNAIEDFRIDAVVFGTDLENNVFFDKELFDLVYEMHVPVFTLCSKNEAPLKQILFPFNEKFITLEKADIVAKLATQYGAKIILLGVSEANTVEKIQIITNHMIHIKTLFEEKGIECETHFKASKDYSDAILRFCETNSVDLIAGIGNSNSLEHMQPALSDENALINSADFGMQKGSVTHKS